MKTLAQFPSEEVARATPGASGPKLPVGTNLCRCPTCHEFFGGVGAFECHRTGGHENRDRACLGRSAMPGAGLQLNSRGYWVRAFAVIDRGVA